MGETGVAASPIAAHTELLEKRSITSDTDAMIITLVSVLTSKSLIERFDAFSLIDIKYRASTTIINIAQTIY